MKTTTTILLASAIGSTLGFAPTSPSQRTSTSLAFFGGQKKAASTKGSPLADEALETYLSKYPADAKTASFFFETWGMPESYQAPKTKTSIFSRENQEIKATFNTIASIYGDEEALKMVKIQPSVLAFQKENFQPSLNAFGENFGYEESKEMIIRNPGLLGANPANAASADNLTMQLSYVIQFTRPIGVVGPAVLIGLLCVPALESALGVGKGELLSALF
ncbi:hypothetical protein QTG54_012117 [Skeletonema marinoi]|uniref:Uncharacterized protein n=1 Tax=Skeletonema marinoi TaxID=267567 RepID=A0AAD9D8Z6_9STRA|nr:hypothetical protein QTG54_012117 [Skeletonema marinoi]